MPTLSLESLIIRNPDLVATEMDGEIVMMSIERGAYFGLNQVASRIWALLESPMRINDICQRLEQEFDIDAERCRVEVLAFADDLLDQGLVRQA